MFEIYIRNSQNEISLESQIPFEAQFARKFVRVADMKFNPLYYKITGSIPPLKLFTPTSQHNKFYSNIEKILLVGNVLRIEILIQSVKYFDH